MKDSIQVDGFAQLEQFGIKPLTGEACAFGMRLLCDLNDEGVALLKEFWGVHNLEFAPAYNSQVDNKPAIGSVMLNRGIWQELAKFAAWKSGALAIYDQAPYGLVLLYSEDLVLKYQAIGKELWRAPGLNRPTQVGSRMQHMATGRVL